jgi:hypothetical protein
MVSRSFHCLCLSSPHTFFRVSIHFLSFSDIHHSPNHLLTSNSQLADPRSFSDSLARRRPAKATKDGQGERQSGTRKTRGRRVSFSISSLQRQLPSASRRFANVAIFEVDSDPCLVRHPISSSAKYHSMHPHASCPSGELKMVEIAEMKRSLPLPPGSEPAATSPIPLLIQVRSCDSTRP